MQINLEMVGPERASELLARNTKNRKLNERTVRILVDQLQKGLWKETHQGIAIAESGELLDGQHRLTAVVRAGVTIPLWVATGMPDSCADVLDTGRKRNPADAFSIHGIVDPSLCSAGARVYDNYRRIPNKGWSGTVAYELSSAELFHIYEDDIGDARALFARQVHNRAYANWKYLTPSVTFALTLLLQDAGHSNHAIIDFFDRLSSGSNLSAGSPILAYRKYAFNGNAAEDKAIRRSKRSNSCLWQQILLAHLIKVWNYEMEGRRLTVFKEPEIPPMPVLISATSSRILSAA